MSALFSIADAEKKIESADIVTYVQHVIGKSRLSRRELSAMLGKTEGFITLQLRRKRISLPLLYALSMHLKVNLFEPFMNQLPDDLQVTRRQVALQSEIETLTTQLAEVTKERDLLKAIVMK